MRVGAVMLAAGAATRMGRVKQLLPYKGGTLIGHAIEQAQQAGFSPVLVVVGAEAESVAAEVKRAAAQAVVNEQWQSGMGSSVTAGVSRLIELDSGLEAVAILLADQPRITARHLSEMLDAFDKRRSPVLAASYAGTLGVPAIFDRAFFGRLVALPPEAGARSLLRGGEAEVEPYPLPEAATDIDTPEDFAALQ